MMLNWARATCGMMGRSPDFMNVTYAAWAGAAEYFAQRPARIRRQHAALLRIHPRKRPDPDPLADQSAAQPHRLGRLQPARKARHCRWCARPTPGSSCGRADPGHTGAARPTRSPSTRRAWGSTPRPQPVRAQLRDPVRHAGLKFLCRESFDLGRSHFDHPLGSRFEEMDCVVFFDDVLVPWERVFLLGDVELLNGTGDGTHSRRIRRIRAPPRTSPNASSCSAWRC